MEKGLSKYWTPGKELEFEEHIKRCRTFAERHLTMTVRDLLKYDHRSKAGKRAVAQGRLRIATATDEELREVAELQEQMQGGGGAAAVPGTLEELKRLRTKIKGKGIKRGELACQ